MNMLPPKVEKSNTERDKGYECKRIDLSIYFSSFYIKYTFLECCVCERLVDDLDLWQFICVGVHVAQAVDHDGEGVLGGVVHKGQEAQVAGDSTEREQAQVENCKLSKN